MLETKEFPDDIDSSVKNILLYLAAAENLSISQMATLFAQAAQVKFQAPIFENKDNVVFDDSYTREVLQLESEI
ncbi:hypothetical protein [Nostoc sp.]|uniref:hypothetical protein n=1 Tax=Nostoc sp. TaxID=1180 RepID=UPI002FFAA97F